MRVILAYAVVIICITITAIQPAGAVAVISAPFMSTDCAGFTFPNSNSALTILEFNQNLATQTDFETFRLDFPAFDRFALDGINNDLALGPTQVTADGVMASANILPFGLVNLAFPSLAQIVFDTRAAQRTYFFTDTF